MLGDTSMREAHITEAVPARRASMVVFPGGVSNDAPRRHRFNASRRVQVQIDGSVITGETRYAECARSFASAWAGKWPARISPASNNVGERCRFKRAEPQKGAGALCVAPAQGNTS